MARYTGASCRLCRREGEKLYLKGERCTTNKWPGEDMLLDSTDKTKRNCKNRKQEDTMEFLVKTFSKSWNPGWIM